MFSSGERGSRLGKGRKRLPEKLKDLIHSDQEFGNAESNHVEELSVSPVPAAVTGYVEDFVDYKARWEQNELKLATMSSSEKSCLEILCAIKESLQSFSLITFQENNVHTNDILDVLSVIRNAVARIPQFQRDAVKHLVEALRNTTFELDDCKQQVKLFKMRLISYLQIIY